MLKKIVARNGQRTRLNTYEASARLIAFARSMGYLRGLRGGPVMILLIAAAREDILEGGDGAILSRAWVAVKRARDMVG